MKDADVASQSARLYPSLPVFNEKTPDEVMDQMVENATTAATFLKAIGHEGRMMILCYLASGEKSVGELESLLSLRQAAVSQQLARLRLEGLIAPRRDGKAIYYRLVDDRAREVMDVIYRLFCENDSC